jgi:aspartate 1-decarboxylase
MGQPGDSVIVLTYCELSDDEASAFEPRIVLVDENNALRMQRNS